MSDTKISEAWPDYLMIRDTQLHDDAGGLGQRIFTTAGAGYEKVKYIRADLAHLHLQPAELAEQQGDAPDPSVIVPTLRAMVRNYSDGHRWDHLDARMCRAAANRIEMLEATLAATGKQQVGEDCTAILAARIALEVELCGSLQRVAKELSIDVGYLSRLARGEKTNPSDEVLEKLGLERTVTYTPIKREYVASPLHPRTKSA